MHNYWGMTSKNQSGNSIFKKTIKNMALTVAFTIVIVLIGWLGTIAIDNSRAQNRQAPLFAIHSNRQMAGAGEREIFYCGVGYTARTSMRDGSPIYFDIGFSTYYSPMYSMEDMLEPFGYYYDNPFYFPEFHLSEFIIVYIVPIIIAYLFYKFIPKLLFINPVFACILTGIMLRANNIVVVLGDYWGEAPYGDWPHVVGLIPYFFIITFVFYLLLNRTPISPTKG